MQSQNLPRKVTRKSITTGHFLNEKHNTKKSKTGEKNNTTAKTQLISAEREIFQDKSQCLQVRFGTFDVRFLKTVKRYPPSSLPLNVNKQQEKISVWNYPLLVSEIFRSGCLVFVWGVGDGADFLSDGSCLDALKSDFSPFIVLNFLLYIYVVEGSFLLWRGWK